MLQIDKKEEGKTLTIALTGKLDSVSAPEFEEILEESLEGVDRLILDLKELKYTSSAGLRVILEAYKTMIERNGMVVKNPDSVVRKIFDSVGFSNFLDIE